MLPAPQIVKAGRFSVHVWTEQAIENALNFCRRLLASGRKTRHQKQKQEKKQTKRKPK